MEFQENLSRTLIVNFENNIELKYHDWYVGERTHNYVNEPLRDQTLG